MTEPLWHPVWAADVRRVAARASDDTLPEILRLALESPLSAYILAEATDAQWSVLEDLARRHGRLQMVHAGQPRNTEGNTENAA